MMIPRRAAPLFIALALCTTSRAADPDPCALEAPAITPDQVVIVVTLEKSSDDSSVPLVGENILDRMSVRARIDDVRQGTFRFPVGSRIDLAIHSIALSFGYDYYGERYAVGIGADDQIAWISPDERRLFRLRGTIVGGRTARGERLLVLDPKGAIVRVQTESREIVSVKLQYPKTYRPEIGKQMCLVALHRPRRADRPYRLARFAFF